MQRVSLHSGRQLRKSSVVAGRDSPWLQPGAACLQSKWELSADMQLVLHAGRITRDCCVWRIPLHIIIPLIMLKEQSPCTWIMALLGITNLNRETRLWEQPVQGRASLTNSSFILFFFFSICTYFNQTVLLSGQENHSRNCFHCC